MTPDLIRALSISAGILIAVVVLIVIVSTAAIKRGEIQMSGQNKHARGH